MNKLVAKPENYRGHLNSGVQKIACTPTSPAPSSVELFPHVPTTDTDPESKKGRKGSAPVDDTSNNQDQKPHHYHADAHPHVHRTTDSSSKPRRGSNVLDAQQMMHEEAIAGHHQVILPTPLYPSPPTIPCPIPNFYLLTDVMCPLLTPEARKNWTLVYSVFLSTRHLNTPDTPSIHPFQYIVFFTHLLTHDIDTSIHPSIHPPLIGRFSKKIQCYQHRKL